MKLYPALKVYGKLYKGAPDDSHVTIAIGRGLNTPSEEQRGFTPDGILFLNRKNALGFLQRHDRKTYDKLPPQAHQIGLHSEHLAEAYGIEQKPQAQQITEDAVSTNLSSKTAIVYDRGGLYLYCAEKLAEKFGKVMYYLADSDAYPTSAKASIGHGLSHVTRIHDFWKNVDKADIIYFFDCYDGELQQWLRDKGYTVFGSGRGEKIEIDKILFLETLEKLGLPCPKTYVAEGMEDMLNYLSDNDGETLYLKNLHRGDFESRKFTSLAQSRPFFNDLRKRLGSACDTLEVLVQHKIDAECEVGYDGYMLDGEYTSNGIIGYEIKDKGFIGKVFPETPDILKEINDAFSDTFKKLGYRGNYSTEVRITKDGVPYYIDATCRVPSPPGEALCELYHNWAEATYQLATGELPKLEPVAKYVAEIVLTSGWHEDHEIHVKFPKSIKRFVKLKNHTVRDGEYYCIPNGNDEFFGAVIGFGNTVDEAVERVLEYAKQIEADGLEYDPAMFDKAKEQIKSGEKFGIKF